MPISVVPTNAPPTSQAVLAVIGQLEPSDVAAAAAHLLTPVDAAPGIDVRVEGGSVLWRGESVRVSGAPWPVVVSSVADLVRRAQVPSDVFLDVANADPVRWLKIIRSGAYCHLYGASELFDAQHVMFDVDVPVDAAYAVAGLVAGGQALLSGRLLIAGRALRVRADDTAALVALD